MQAQYLIYARQPLDSIQGLYKTKLKIFNTYSRIYKDCRNVGSAH